MLIKVNYISHPKFLQFSGVVGETQTIEKYENDFKKTKF